MGQHMEPCSTMERWLVTVTPRVRAVARARRRCGGLIARPSGEVRVEIALGRSEMEVPTELWLSNEGAAECLTCRG